ncbi:MAG TPA: Ig-like domain-containing protein, partial [Anaerovoracaceae bacterium]|nr:Ig-like domain-containing protein [Anaerovoracaceae bacterium]
WTYNTGTQSAGLRSYAIEGNYDSGPVSTPRTLKVGLPLTIDRTTLLLDGIKFLQSYGWSSKKVSGNTASRQAEGGVPPYTYQSDNPAVASVIASTGEVTGLKTGTTTIRAIDATNASVLYQVTVKNIFEVNKGTQDYPGDLSGKAMAEQWVRSVGGIDNAGIVQVVTPDSLADNFNNLLDLFEGQFDLPKARVVGYEARPGYGWKIFMASASGPIYLSAGTSSPTNLVRGIAFVPK